MATFVGVPNELVRFVPQIKNIRHLRFDADGKITTENPKIIARLSRKFKELKEESFNCKKCEFSTDNKGLLMSHYRSEHPKEEDHE